MIKMKIFVIYFLVFFIFVFKKKTYKKTIFREIDKEERKFHVRILHSFADTYLLHITGRGGRPGLHIKTAYYPIHIFNASIQYNYLYRMFNKVLRINFQAYRRAAPPRRRKVNRCLKSFPVISQ